MNLLEKFLTVWVCGGIGAITRYAIETFMHARGWASGNIMGLPTLVINVPACFIIGLVAGYLYNSQWPDGVKTFFSLAAMTGFCGGFSTFSSYTLDSLHYFEEGKLKIWIVFGLLTLFLSLFVCAIGYFLGKKI